MAELADCHRAPRWTWARDARAAAAVSADTQSAPGDRVFLLYVGAERIARRVLARSPEPVASPGGGHVATEAVTAGHLGVRASGVGLRRPGRLGTTGGRTGRHRGHRHRTRSCGRAPSTSARRAASWSPARGLDIEALTRARAIGVAGIICGGVVGRELAQLEESDVRQRAALHTATPFAILALDGYGRRPMPDVAWDLLVAAAADRSTGRLLPESGLAVVPEPPHGPSDTLGAGCGAHHGG